MLATIFIHVCVCVCTLALVAEQQVTPDVPIALVQLSSLNQSSLLSVSYSQLYAFSNWSISQGQSSSSSIYYRYSMLMHTYTGTASQPPTVAVEPDANICMFHSLVFFFFFPVHNFTTSSLSLSLPLSPSPWAQGWDPGLVILWIRVPLHLLPVLPLSLAARSSLSVASGTTASSALPQTLV